MKKILQTLIFLMCVSLAFGQGGIGWDKGPVGYTNSVVQTIWGGWLFDRRGSDLDTTGTWVDQAVGSDANAGTFAAPYATIRRAATSVVANATIKIRAGTYAEGFITNKNAGLTFMGMDPGTEASGFWVTNANVTFDGQDVWVISGTGIANSATYGSITFNAGAHNGVVKRCAVFSPQRGFPFVTGMTSIQIKNTNNVNTAVTNITITRNVFTNQGGDCLGLSGAGTIVSNNLWSDPHGYDSIRALADNILVSGNVWSNMSNGPHNGPVTNTLHCDILQTFPNNGEHATNIVFEKNWIFGGVGQVQWNLGANLNATNESFKYFTFRNNIVFNMDGQLGTWIPHTWIYNNTFVWVGFQAAANPVSWQFLMDVSHGDAYNGRAWNNLFWTCGNNPGTNGFNANGWYDTYATAAGSNWTSGGQYFFDADYNMASGYSNDTKRTGAWPLWGSTTNGITTEVHGVNGGDPLLNGTNFAQFAPLPGSPLLNAGTNLSVLFPGGVATDIDGNPRPTSGAWTIGAKQ